VEEESRSEAASGKKLIKALQVKEKSGDRPARVSAGNRHRLDWQARPKPAVALADRVLHVCQPHNIQRDGTVSFCDQAKHYTKLYSDEFWFQIYLTYLWVA
jgi:hypothetical protein